MKRALIFFVLSILAPALAATPASAALHWMQIEQVIGGVDGNTNIQAIQLRMRMAGQSQVQFGRIRAWDAAGANPVVLINFGTSVTNGAAGARVLAATADFQAATSPNLAPDFVMAPIPASYLPAGSITFEDDAGSTIYWRLSWGGASYTGTGAGGIDNDADGQFNPPFPGPLPSTSGRALQFTGAANALSTNNAAQYALTAGSATFMRNNGSTGQVVSVVGVGDDWSDLGIALGPPTPNPASASVSYAVSLPRFARVEVTAFDLRGRAVRKLLDQDLPSGRHQFTWDIAGDDPSLPGGIYFLALEVDGRRSVRRVAYLRGSHPVHPDHD